MRRTSIYYPLRYIVQCQPAGQAFFETICAFNLAAVAIEYAETCFTHQTIDGFKYRVVDHHNNEDKCIYRAEVA